jgi:signal transduction histidine kinase
MHIPLSLQTYWEHLNLNHKIRLVFGFLLIIILLIAGISTFTTYRTQREFEQTSDYSNEILRKILQLHLALDKAQLMEQGFLQSYLDDGYVYAYQTFAIPATQALGEALALNQSLNQTLIDSPYQAKWDSYETDIRFHNLAIYRRAEAFDEALVLTKELTQSNGLYEQLNLTFDQIGELSRRANNAELTALFADFETQHNNYLLTYRRPTMQTALNLRDPLLQTFQETNTLTDAQIDIGLSLISQYASIANKILTINVELQSLTNEITLITQSVSPILQRLIELADTELTMAQTQVQNRKNWALSLVVLISLSGIAMFFGAQRLFNTSITQNIIALQTATTNYKNGHFDSRVRVETQDELGVLAETYNQMAVQLEILIGNLEKQVADRTSALTKSNKQLTNEIAERKKVQAELSAYSNSLEKIVEERTQALIDMKERSHRQERLILLGQLSGNIGHELRNPLGAITNAIYFLRMSLNAPSTKTHEHLDIIENQARSASKIIEDLLNYSKSKDVERFPVLASELIRDVIVENPSPDNINIYWHTHPATRILIDEGQIKQVFRNLLANAYQAMPDGGELKISTETTVDGVVIKVADTGEGIAPNEINKIFEPLYTTKKKGIGLGLAVSQSIVLANGGDITVESELDVGTTFKLRFAHAPPNLETNKNTTLEISI